MRRLFQQPFYCFLLPLFFVLHGYVQNYGLLPGTEALRLLLIYGFIAGLLLLACQRLFVSRAKAGTFVFVLLGMELFYGAVIDALHNRIPLLPASPVAALPLLLLILFLLTIWLRRAKEPLALQSFLNLLLLVLLLVDAGGWWKKNAGQASEKARRAWSINKATGQKPDVFLIIADEYAGNRQLTELLHFDNSPFLDSLRQRGFQVDDDARSNYNYTEYSTASLLNGAYFPAASRTNAADVGRCFSWIRNNEASAFFKSQGYALHNLSIFDMDDAPSPSPRTWNDQWNNILRQQTLSARMYNRLTGPAKESATFEAVNNALLAATDSLLSQPAPSPRFVYTHLLLPHSPYYRDATGRPKVTFDRFNTDAYLQYLQYGNGVYLQLVDTILRKAQRPTVILLMADHGFRSLRQAVDKEYFFMNLSAVYYTPGLMREWPAGKGMINQFRILLDSCFAQQLPMLPNERHFIGEQDH
ncbi:MAG: hypothetical protein EOO15_08325 [Chitinophagaceae bacterium]|nr:MAG: hypothetical protein EOO15_08325 [Chitinophagaceae bacterium]